MRFIIDSPDDEHSWANYQQYLETIKSLIPQAAYEYATAVWHYDFNDPHSLHDASLVEIVIAEVEPNGYATDKLIQIHARFENAFQNGHIELLYKNVRSYTLSKMFTQVDQSHSHWQYDEIRLSEAGFVIHEARLLHGRWLIECEDINYKFIPISSEFIHVFIDQQMAYIPRISSMQRFSEKPLIKVNLAADQAVEQVAEAIAEIQSWRGRIDQRLDSVISALAVQNRTGFGSIGRQYTIELRTYETLLHVLMSDNTGHFVSDPKKRQEFHNYVSPMELARAILGDVYNQPKE